ncbi:oxidoreductase [Arthrobacter sp. CAU 1506]|uniref:PDR/VanB family oxidoreductase n=1 Tax=Arthrobacter sp. CAU 1506 TaxID=2560052 RepID=UPI0010AC76CF|nr:PDR/VanB family oxidoreductase [Arthrobacter sp. CAU 1506]TJY66304.1 oxidoreductase [Arthrobacter sp. CAU 1506]
MLVRVADIESETPDIRTLRLVRTDGTLFPLYSPGAHIDVTGPTGVLRQYSLCSPPGDPSSLLIAVKREPNSRGGSVALHEVKVGDHLKISEPRNLLTIAEDASEHVLVAGGIGVTPLLSMAYELWQRGADFTLHYFASSREKMSFREFLEERAEFRHRVRLHFGVPLKERTRLLTKVAKGLPAGTHAYTCGPGPFMEHVTSILAPVVGEGNVHVEHFVAEGIDTSRDKPFVVELDGVEYDIPEDQSILGVLEENGVEVFKSCEEGICGSCISGVLEGVPDHRDSCLSNADKAAGKEMALCVSRALTDKLVIELY